MAVIKAARPFLQSVGKKLKGVFVCLFFFLLLQPTNLPFVTEIGPYSNIGLLDLKLMRFTNTIINGGFEEKICSVLRVGELTGLT